MKSIQPDPYWYVLQTAPGEASRVADSLRGQAGKLGLAGRIIEIRCPEQNRDASSSVSMPGFFLVRMCWDASVWTTLRRFPGVTGYLGQRNVPLPVTERELPMVVRQMAKSVRAKTIVRIHGEDPAE